MKQYPIDDLQLDMFFSSPLFIDDDFILLSPETPVTTALIKRLKNWQYKNVFSEGAPFKNPLFSSNSEIDNELSAGDKKSCSEEDEAAAVYDRLAAFIENMIITYKSTGKLDIGEITSRVRDIIDSFDDKKDSLLSCISGTHQMDDYLILHLTNSTILSLAIGDFLKLPPHRLIELGLTSILHEIGMTKIPNELYMSDEKLTDQEKNTIMAHTVLGYRIIKSLSVSEAVARGVLEHQERLDGSGYPNHLMGDAISLYGRIIAVACSYDAMVSKRPFKNIKSTGHQTILTLLKTDRKAYDEKVLKALVYVLSFYVLGTEVLLSNNTSGIVYRTNPKDPKYPIVKVVIGQNGEHLPEPLLIRTSPDSNIVISRILTLNSTNPK